MAIGVATLDRSLLKLAQRDVISGKIDKWFTGRTESDDYD